MSDTIIRVDGLSKRYSLKHRLEGQQYKALRDVISNGARALARPFLKKEQDTVNPGREDFWALKEVSFEVKQGDRIGIIGRNGAGKSTLLKILSRIVEPTEGRIAIKGRVASLLEVGTGFHPELTGRENIYLNGAILGMGKTEIKRKFDEIVDFAEVEKFLDTPVKRYSSGMYVRLAFAVAAHLEPEILIVDEVLAVGDASFQKKCLGKMKDVSGEGRTVIFVSHNMSAIEALCSKAVVLSRGQVEFVGSVRDSIARYVAQNNVSTSGSVDFQATKVDRHGPQEFSFLRNLCLLNNQNSPTDRLKMGEPAKFRTTIEFKSPGDSFEVGISISNIYGVSLHYLVSNWEDKLEIYEPGNHQLEVTIPNIYLFPGEYFVNIWVKRQGSSYDDAVHEALKFHVDEGQISREYAYFERYSNNTQVYTPSYWQVSSMKAHSLS